MPTAAWIEQAIGPATFGDRRRRQRWATTISQLAADPAASVADACQGDWAAVVGVYRCWANDHLPVRELVASIGQATAQRTAAAPVVVVVHDTTAIRVRADQRCPEVGPLNNHPEIRGLWVHSSLAVTPSGLPLGLLDQQHWTRARTAPPSRPQRYRTPIEGKESAKWLRGIQAAHDRLTPGQQRIHVADREADLFECYQLLAALGDDFVLRAAQERHVNDADALLSQAAADAPMLGTLEVLVQRADDRPARTATVQVQAGPVTLQPPGYQSHAAARRRWWAAHPDVTPLVAVPLQPQPLGLVEVTEPQPPAHGEPLHWRLLTSLPVTTLAEAEHVIELYRRRWLVERFHYVLKQGCQIERLQLEQVARWARAIVSYSVVAWHVLWLTYLGRTDPQAAGSQVISPAAWAVLVALGVADGDPAHVPRVAVVLQAVARLGGYLGRQHDGPPGLKVVWRGWTKLETIQLGWEAAHHDLDRSV